MRIDAYNKIEHMYGYQKTQKVQKTHAMSKATDGLSISQMGRDIQIAKNAVSQASDIREDKVATLKDMIDSGKYQVDEGDFASKLLEKYNAL